MVEKGEKEDDMSRHPLCWTSCREDEETVTLPTVPVLPRSGASPVSLSPAHACQLQGHTIWIIDDSPTIRAVTAMHLRPVGIAVQPFGDGCEALLYLRHHPDEVPPLILLDLELPRLDGYAVARSLRSLACCARTAIVMLSARNAPGDQIRGRLAGVDEYLVKPVTSAALVTMALTYLGRAAASSSAEREGAVCHES